ncbi:Ig domain-containing protein,Calx-beta domain-containing protein, partial [bacterium]
EGNTGVKTIKASLQLSKKSETDLIVNFATKSGTAKADNDFESKSGTLTFPKGSTKIDVFFNLKSDKTFEPDETFTVTFSKVTVPFKGSNTLTVTIANDDADPNPTPTPSANQS